MDMLAAQRMPTLVYHMPWPGLGHLAKRGDGFHYVPGADATGAVHRRLGGRDGRGRVVSAAVVD